MDIFNVNAAQIPGRRRLGNLIVSFAAYTAAYFAIEWLWPWHRGEYRVLQVFIQAVLWGSGMSLMSSFEKANEYQIVVDEDTISTRNFKYGKSLLSRSLSRDQVRTVLERKQGLLISPHNRFGTFFWGGIWIPKRMADYEYLKRLVLSWKVEKTT